MAENCSPDTQACQSNNTLEVVNSSGSLDESQVLQSTPASGKRKDIGWLEEYRAASMKRKMKDQDSQSTAKRGALTDITKQTTNNGNGRHGRTAKKRGHETSNKKDCTETVQKPRTTEQKNADHEQDIEHSSKHKSNTEHKHVKMEVKEGLVPVRFKWSGKVNNGLTTIGANPDEAIYDALKKCKKFTKKFQPMHSLIITGSKIHAEINPSAPCGSLAEEEELELRKTVKQLPNTPPYPEGSGGLFRKVIKQGKSEGGKPIVILHENYPRKNILPLAVFGYKHQSIMEVLHNDKRFKHLSSFSLQGTKGETFDSEMEWSLLPEDSYTVVDPILLEDKSLSTDDVCKLSSIEKPSIEPHPVSAPKVTETMKKIIATLRKDFGEHLKTNNGRRKAWRVIKENYDNVTKSPLSARTVNLLSQHLHSIGFIFCRISGQIEQLGSCFVLCKCQDNRLLCLTCHHVVADRQNLENYGHGFEVLFTYNEGYQSLRDQPSYPIEVLGGNEEYDCAFFLADTSNDPDPPEGLLQHIAPPINDDAVSIIGHPRGEYKQCDTKCSVVNFSNRPDEIAKYLHLLSAYNFSGIDDPRRMTYVTDGFYHGASGSLVFNKYGEIVAMHQGGYTIKTPQHLTKNIMEFGRDIVDIIIVGATEIEDLRIQFKKIVEQKDSLKCYLDQGSHPDHLQPMIRRLKRQWGMTDLTSQRDNGEESDMEIE